MVKAGKYILKITSEVNGSSQCNGGAHKHVMHYIKIVPNFRKYSKIFISKGIPSQESNMSTFVSHFNPLTGKTEWRFQDENYDYQQEIAR